MKTHQSSLSIISCQEPSIPSTSREWPVNVRKIEENAEISVQCGFVIDVTLTYPKPLSHAQVTPAGRDGRCNFHTFIE